MSDPIVGEIRMFAGDYAPTGWALCQGQTLQIEEYQKLYDLIGTTYGGDGVTTFNLPNLSSRTPVHQGSSPYGTYYEVGAAGGVEQMTLTTSELPSHTHALLASEAPADQLTPLNDMPAEAVKRFYAPPGAAVAMANMAVTVAGADHPHDNMQPYLVVSFVIALDGVIPTAS